jgi:hypothetical protein
LGNGRELFDSWDTTRLLEQIKEHRSRIRELLRDDSPEISLDYETNFARILEALFQEVPKERISVADLAKDKWLMNIQNSPETSRIIGSSIACL